jgi:hypothetical protein
MPATYKIRAMFYAGDEKTPVDPDDLSGQEFQSLEDTIHGFAPKGGMLEIDCETFQITYEDGNGPASFPEDWQEAHFGKMIAIQPRQYGLNPWPNKMYVKFESIYYRDEDGDYDYER